MEGASNAEVMFSGSAGPADVASRVDQANVRKRLRKVANEALRPCVVFLSDVIAAVRARREQMSRIALKAIVRVTIPEW